MTPLTHGSLFAGYGGLDLAIADVFGATTAWVSEWEAAPSRVLAHHYPDAPNLGDITRVDWATVPRVDIISGGSPCQDLSMAGRRAGMTPGTRSNLWVAMREAIAVLKPTYVVWENVRGAMSAEASSDLEHCPGCMGDPRDRGPVLRALGRVLGDLADLGYDAQWHGLRAADVGACHGRFRVFVLAYTNDARSQGQPHPTVATPAQRHGHPVAGAGRPDLTLLPTPAAGLFNDGESADTWLARRERVKLTARNGNGMGTPLSIAVQLLPTPTSNLGDNGGPQDPAKRRAGGHSVSIEDAVHGLALLPTPKASNNEDRQNEDRYGPNLGMALGVTPGYEARLLPTPSVADTQGGRKSRSGERNGELLLNGIAHANRWGEYAAAIARHEQAFGRPAPAPTEPGPKGNPRLSARFVEWMMALPAGWVTDVPGVTRNQALKALGNGVVPPQCAAALRLMLARTLTPSH